MKSKWEISGLEDYMAFLEKAGKDVNTISRSGLAEAGNMLKNAMVDGLPTDWWYYNRFTDGRTITRAHRLLYRQRPDLENGFPDPFVAGPGSYVEWFDQHAKGKNGGDMLK